MLKQIINPFIDATVECFVTMMGSKPSLNDISFDQPPIEVANVCATIGLSGDAQGIVALSFVNQSAIKAASRFLDEPEDDIKDDLFDAVGEIINIIAGSAKSQVAGHKLSISLPTVTSGENFVVQLPKGVPSMTISFNVPDIGEVLVVVAMKVNQLKKEEMNPSPL